MQHTFLDRAHGVYREESGRDGTARAWPYSQALAATLAMTRVPTRGRLYVPDAARRVSGLGGYLRRDGAFAAVMGPRGDIYYDDNEWIALELLRWYDLRSTPQALARAKRLFKLVVSAWDADVTHACPGGVFWTTAPGNRDRNTVTTATGALLGLELYARTHDPNQLAWAQRMLGWVTACMLAPDGLLWDHVGLDGTRDETHWSYNQGTAIGANVLLYRLTGDKAALERAEALADTSLAYFDRTPGGREPAFFLAIWFRNLLALESVDGDARYREALRSTRTPPGTGCAISRPGFSTSAGRGPRSCSSRRRWCRSTPRLPCLRENELDCSGLVISDGRWAEPGVLMTAPQAAPQGKMSGIVAVAPRSRTPESTSRPRSNQRGRAATASPQ